MHTWVSFYGPKYTGSVCLSILFNISAGTFSEAVLEELKGHPNVEFVTEDSEQYEFEVTTQSVIVAPTPTFPHC